MEGEKHMNHKYIKLCQRLQELGIKSISGEVFRHGNISGYYKSMDITSPDIKFPAYSISDILRKEFWMETSGKESGVMKYETAGYDLKKEMPLWEFKRLLALQLWDLDDNKPLGRSNQVIDYLLDNIKNNEKWRERYEKRTTT